jgi:DNA-binding NarL/FixJ family response regulator
VTIRVLLADDHTVVREGLRALLAASAGISVVGEVDNGREALRRAGELGPDVVVMDIAMPELNGIEAAAMIRSLRPGTQVVILSMHSSSEHVYRAFAAGAAGYVLKSSAGAEVISAVQTVHLGRRYLSPALREAYANAVDDPARASPLDRLSARERQVLQLVVEGKSSAEIADVFHLSRKTIESYRSRIMQKLGVHDVPSLVKFALQHGIISVA